MTVKSSIAAAVEDLWLVSEGGSTQVESRLHLQATLQSDPTAMAKIRAEYEVRRQACQSLQATCKAGGQVDEEDFAHAYGDLVKMQSSELAIITIDGALETNESYWHKYMSIPSYSRIRDILDTLKYMGTVKEVLFVWRSPGGNAKGSFALADHMAKLQNEGLRMTSFADTGMMSAAILLGVVPKEIYANADADIGSVGAMSVVMTRRKMIEEMGVEVKTFKYGRLKDIGSPYRDMTKEEEDFFQSRINKMGAQIAMHVQKHRAMTPDQFESAAGEARIVFGSEAAASGLIDGVKTLDEVVNTILARHNAQQPTTTAASGGINMNIRLNAQGLAAVASGMTAEEAMANHAFVEEVAESEGVPEANPANEEAAAALPEETAAAAAPAVMDTQLAALVSQVTEEKIKSHVLTTERDQLAAKLATVEAQLAQLSPIAAKATMNLEVACGSTTATEASLMALGSEALAARHAELTAMFKSKMPVGQRSVASGASAGKERASVPPAALRSQLDAVGLS